MATDVNASSVELETLAVGAGRPIVVFDFVPLSTGPTAGDTITRAQPSRLILRADVVADITGDAETRPLADLSTRYADAVAAVSAKSVDIVGYCSAAPLALAVSAELENRGTKVVTVLAAPAFPDRDLVHTELAEIRRTIGGAKDPTVSLPAEFAMAARRIRETIVTDLAVAADHRGMSPAQAEMLRDLLGGRYIAWLCYLLSAADATPPPPPSDVRAIITSDALPQSSANTLRYRQVIASAVAQHEFLTDESVSATLSDLLEVTA